MDSQNADSDVVLESGDRGTLMEQYEKKVEEFFKVEENIHDVANQVYSRSLIQLVRDIIKTFQTFHCPLSEEELKKIGIDRATMVSRFIIKYPRRADNTNPSCGEEAQANNIRRPYQFSSSDNKKNTKKQRSPPFTDRPDRPSIPRPEQKIKRGENAWIPEVAKQKANVKLEIDCFEAREKDKKEVRGLLNKIAPSTYQDLSKEMINKALWKDVDTVTTVFELIFKKAEEEPRLVEQYADLCRALYTAERNMEKDKYGRRFFEAIIKKIQITFEIIPGPAYQESLAKLEDKIKEETDEKKVADLYVQLEELKTKEKRCMLNTIRFISNLYRIGLLNSKVIENCIVLLLRNVAASNNELMVEYAIHLIENVGPFMALKAKDSESLKKMDDYTVYLSHLKGSVSNRVRFMILGLADFSQEKWIKKDDAPKTKEEVIAYIAKKEEHWRKERENHKQSVADKKRKAHKPVKPPYVGRTSDDSKRNNPNVAVAASIGAGSSNVHKDNSLAKVDTHHRLPGIKSLNANTNLPTPSQSIRGKKPIPSRSTTDARSYRNDLSNHSNPQDDRKPPASNHNQKADSRPASASSPPVDASSSVSTVHKFQNKAYKEKFTKAALLFMNEAPDEEVQKVLNDVFIAINDPVVFFGALLVFASEHLKQSNEKERLAVSDWIVKFVQDAPRKKAFATAFKDYSNYIVSTELEMDMPKLKHTFPELVAHIMTNQSADKKVEISHFVDGFKEFHKGGNLMFVRTLAEIANILKQRGVDSLGLVMEITLGEFAALDKHYDSTNIKNLMARQNIDDENYMNLLALIDSP